jgi:AcrR family transcriptional regulator
VAELRHCRKNGVMPTRAPALARKRPVTATKRLRAPRRSGRQGVGEIQRARVLSAMVEVTRERGVANVTVSHVVARSGVSRRTFYELFDNLQECFLAAFDQAIAQASVTIVEAYSRPGRWREQVKAGLTALLEFLDDEPEMGAHMVVDALGAGTKALERRANVLTVLIDVVDRGKDEAKAGKRPTRLTAEGVVGSVFAVLHARLLERPPISDRSELLTGLLNPLMAMVVLPYLGPGAARKELERPVPRARARTVRPHRDPLKGLDMRLTYRTVRVLLTIGANPGASNRQVAQRSGISDQGQMSKLLTRLEHLGLIDNAGNGAARGEPNAWGLTGKGLEVQQAVQIQTGRS